MPEHGSVADPGVKKLDEICTVMTVPFYKVECITIMMQVRPTQQIYNLN